MHELWICKNLFNIVSQQLAGKQYTRIKKIVVEIGELVALDHTSLVFCFEAMAKESMANGALLEIIAVPGAGICADCAERVTVNHYATPCSHCGNYSLKIVQGEELRIKALEVE